MQNVKLLFWNILIIYYNTVFEFTKCSSQLTIQEFFYYPWLQSFIKVEISQF